MKIFLQTVLLCAVFTLPIYAQQTIGGINSGAVSNNGLIYSVGEIFVTPVNANETSSGIIGIASQVLDIKVGVCEMVFDNSVNLYPNPTAGHVSILLEKPETFKTITVINAAGQLVHTQVFQNGQLDLSHLPNGTYILQTDNATIQPIRFIKQ